MQSSLYVFAGAVPVLLPGTKSRLRKLKRKREAELEEMGNSIDEIVALHEAKVANIDEALSNSPNPDLELLTLQGDLKAALELALGVQKEVLLQAQKHLQIDLDEELREVRKAARKSIQSDRQSVIRSEH